MPRDTWKAYDTEANRHVTAYLLRHGKRLFADSAYDPAKRSITVGPKSREAERILYDFARSWAEDMRAYPVPQDGGVEWFNDAMARAELEIARRFAELDVTNSVT